MHYTDIVVMLHPDMREPIAYPLGASSFNFKGN